MPLERARGILRMFNFAFLQYVKIHYSQQGGIEAWPLTLCPVLPNESDFAYLQYTKEAMLVIVMPRKRRLRFLGQWTVSPNKSDFAFLQYIKMHVRNIVAVTNRDRRHHQSCLKNLRTVLPNDSDFTFLPYIIKIAN